MAMVNTFLAFSYRYHPYDHITSTHESIMLEMYECIIVIALPLAVFQFSHRNSHYLHSGHFLLCSQ